MINIKDWENFGDYVEFALNEINGEKISSEFLAKQVETKIFITFSYIFFFFLPSIKMKRTKISRRGMSQL